MRRIIGRRTCIVSDLHQRWYIQAIPEPGLEDKHGHGPNSAFFNVNVKAHVLDDSSLFIDRKAFGIPFMIDDDAALDAAYAHHGCAVEVQSVERLLLPFWLCAASAGGYFSSEVFKKNPLTLSTDYVWHEVPFYEFSYPFGDHFPFNQIVATHDPSAAMAEHVCTGNHVPSMLISRFELVEELESMTNPPRFVPFELTTKSAVNILEKRIDRELVHAKAIQELRKFHGHFTTANLKFLSIVAEITRAKPIFLPMYAMKVTTASHSEPLPLAVCGATGRTRGPVVHRSHNSKFLLSAAAGAATLVAGAYTMSALPAVVGALSVAYGAAELQRRYLLHGAMRDQRETQSYHKRRQDACAESDKTGYKWTVEDEEAMEYCYREEIRAKARRRADFEQRVKEEAAREEARATGRTFTSHGRRHRSTLNASNAVDPLSYYELLGLKGKEKTATTKDIAQAFRREAQKHHPDMASPDKQEQAKSKMQQLIEAYGVLRDSKLRKEYDDGSLSSVSASPRRRSDQGDGAPDDAAKEERQEDTADSKQKA